MKLYDDVMMRYLRGYVILPQAFAICLCVLE